MLNLFVFHRTKIDKRGMNQETNAPIKSKKLKKYYKACQAEEATSPCPPFQLASKFFTPETETIDVSTSKTTAMSNNQYTDVMMPTNTRRPRSSTIPPQDIQEGSSAHTF